MSPSVSIAMGTFEGARFLEEQLDSLRAQTRPPDELVVCDDGSTDRTLEVLEEFSRTAPFPVRIQRNPARLGWVDNFLAAARGCGGDLIAFCDQDDVWLPHKLSRCVEAFEASDSPSAVMHAAEVVDERLARTGARHPDIPRSERIRPTEYPTFVGGPGFALCFTRELLDLVREPPVPPDARLLYGHDTLIVLLAGAGRGLLLLAEPLVLYRRHGGNATGYGEEAGPAKLLRRRRPHDFERLIDAKEAVEDRAAVLRWSLEGLEASSSPARGVADLLDAHREFAAALGERARIYAPGVSALGRVGALTRAAARRRYSPGRSGSLGRRALAKDSVAALTGLVYRS